MWKYPDSRRLLLILSMVGVLVFLHPSNGSSQPQSGEVVEEDSPGDEVEAGSVASEDDLVPIEATSLLDLLSAPIVESASRRLQSFFDAPSSVTVLEGEQIRQMGARNPAELFRRVAGAHVMSLSSNEYEVGFRGRMLPANNRVQIRLDGRSVLEPSMARSPWPAPT